MVRVNRRWVCDASFTVCIFCDWQQWHAAGVATAYLHFHHARHAACATHGCQTVVSNPCQYDGNVCSYWQPHTVGTLKTREWKTRDQIFTGRKGGTTVYGTRNG